MKRTILLIIIAFVFCFSCKNDKPQKEEDKVANVKEEATDSLPKPNENLVTIRRAKHKTTECGKPKIVSAQKPSVYPTNTNVNLISDLSFTVVSDALYETVPGEDNLELPIVNSA